MSRSTVCTHTIDTLGIVDLPESCMRLMPQRIYAVICEHFDYTRDIIKQVNASHHKMNIVCVSDPHKFNAIALPTDQQPSTLFQQKIRDGNVQLYHIQPNSMLSTAHRNLPALRQFIRELTYSVRANNCLIVIENGLQLLGIQDQNQLEHYPHIWLEFLRRYNNSVLMMISGINSDPMLLNNLHLIQDKLAGLAHVTPVGLAAKFTVQHWYSSEGICANRQFDLARDPDGTLRAKENLDTENKQATPPAIDSGSVWTLQQVVKGQHYPKNWSISIHFEQLDIASTSAVSGTIILPYLRETVIKDLARFVFASRQSRGKRIKIVICELSARLRHSEERLLRYLGASVVVPLEVSFSRLIGIVEAIKDLEFEGELTEDFDQAFVLASPKREQGYFSPNVFIKHVNELMLQSQRFGVKFALLQLTVFKAMRVQDALKIANLRRPGDLCTAGSDCLYLFLFGCRETDVATALSFIFNLPIAQLFALEVRNITIDETLLALEPLQQEISSGTDIDHSRWLAKHKQSAASKQNTAQSTGDPVSNRSATQGSFDRKPAIAAINKPLRLRSEPSIIPTKTDRTEQEISY